MPQLSENPFILGIISFIPVAKMSFFAVNSSFEFVVMLKPFEVFLALTANPLRILTVLYFKTCAFAFSKITLGFSPSCVIKLCECGVCRLHGCPLSIIKTFRNERPNAIAAESPA